MRSNQYWLIMARKCSAPGCLTGYRRKKDDDKETYATFKFPTHNLELLEKWKKFANVDSLGKHSALCELHFNESDIRRSGMRRTLDWKKDPVPTIRPEIKTKDTPKNQNIQKTPSAGTKKK